MRWFPLALLLLVGCTRHAPARDDPAPAQDPGRLADPAGSTARPFAVVELFTSEGCSSCPPADQHLAELEADARARGRNVFLLSFHVDYWNHLGWRDPFSDERHSERQRLYARALSRGQLYTPQMVVNGREEFVGTARAKVSIAIERGLSQPAPMTIALVPKLENRRLEVACKIQGDTRNALLNLAVTETVPAVEVLRGENAGRKLSHRGVVRVFTSRELDGEHAGSLSLDLPAGLETERAAVVAYAADRDTLAVLGAVSVDLRR